jgi:hypothetical protein
MEHCYQALAEGQMGVGTALEHGTGKGFVLNVLQGSCLAD